MAHEPQTALLLHCLLVCLCSVPLVVVSAASPNEENRIRVGESASRATFGDKLCKLSLAVENATGTPLAAEASFDLLDPDDKIASQSRSFAELKRGMNRFESALALPVLMRSWSAR